VNQNARTVLFMTGGLLCALSLAMLIPAIADLQDSAEAAHAFFGSAVTGLAAGGVMTLMGRGGSYSLSPRGAILLTGGSWMVLAAAAAVPLRLAGLELSWTDAIFETMSGLTTTGATVLTGLQDLPAGILLWRSILQWIGGIGIIVTAMAVWPMLGIGGMQLFRLESSDKTDKVLPRAGQIALAVSLIYMALTFACFLSYLAAAMSPFDAINHAMTTVATGGFSTHDGSIGAFAHGGADLVALVFMIAGALPFALYIRAAQGRPDALFADSQVRAFIVTVFAAAALLTLWLTFAGPPETADGTPAWRLAAVNAVSVMTGTGYASDDFWAWGGGAAAIFFVLMFIGGCAGSTTCSIKIFRYQIAISAMHAYIVQYARPSAVHPVRYRGKTVPDETVRSVLGFMFLFFASFAVSAALLSLTGLDTVTALSGAATSLANVGPGLGDMIGPANNFQLLPDAAKWIMTFTMLTGRLEIMVMLVMFTPGFWQR